VPGPPNRVRAQLSHGSPTVTEPSPFASIEQGLPAGPGYHRPGPALRRVRDLAGSLRKLLQALRAQWQLRGCDTVPLTVTLDGRVRVRNRGRIELGDRVRFDAHIVPTQLSAEGGRLSIGERTYLNYGVSIGVRQEVAIGANCLIGQYVIIMDSDYHDLVTRAAPGPVAPVVIEDDVWLGARVVVLKGVRIGRGSAIGAGSVVTRDIPPGCLAAGVPARVVRKL
jgi:acetyltransferase-like isoleucine patch superfamily enzyme